MGAAKYQNDGDPRTCGPGFGLTVHPDALLLPYDWRSPQLVFVNSMSDLFHARVPVASSQRVFAVMADTPRHTYQVLTKRAQRLRRIADGLMAGERLDGRVGGERRAPPRADDLRRPRPRSGSCPGAAAGSAVGLDLAGIDWVIAGGESGPRLGRSNGMVPDIRDACEAAGVPFFFKQWGGRTPKAGGRTLDGQIFDEMPERVRVAM